MQSAGVGQKSTALVSATCLHIASKCEDISYIGVEDLSTRANQLFTSADLLATEELVLKGLDFFLSAATIIDFVHVYIGIYFASTDQSSIVTLCSYLAELSLYWSPWKNVPKSMIGQAIVFCAGLWMHSFEDKEGENTILAWADKFDLKLLRTCAEETISMHEWGAANAQTSTFKRYARKSHPPPVWIGLSEAMRSNWEAIKGNLNSDCT